MSVQNTTTGKSITASLMACTAQVAALTAVAWVASSVIVVFLPNWGPRLEVHASYADAVTFLLGLVLSVLALTGLHRRQAGRAGRLGQVGYWLIVVPFALVAVWDMAELIVGGGIAVPVYPIYAVVSRLGFILWGIAAYRAKVLPRWLGPVLALAWVIAPPFGALPASFAIPVSWAVAALAMWRPTGSAG